MEDKELSQTESAETSQKVAEAKEGSDSMITTVGYCGPALKYHAEKVYSSTFAP